MKINEATFVKSVVDIKECPRDGLQEIAFVGRSNVGKSSLINYLISRKRLARTSSSPGRTQTLNYYLINQKLYLVDLPGYGYAKVSRQMRNIWRQLMQTYIQKGSALAGVIQVVDIRHPPSKEDVWMNQLLQTSGLSYLVVATKADKMSRGQWNKQRTVIASTLKCPLSEVAIVSSVQGQGRDDVWRWIKGALMKSQCMKEMLSEDNTTEGDVHRER